MPAPTLDSELEAATIALNACLYAEDAGLPVAPDAYDAPTATLNHLYADMLAGADAGGRLFAIDAQAEAHRLPRDHAVAAAIDAHLPSATLTVAGQPLSWRNWKAYERASVASAEALNAGFDHMLARSAHIVPALEARAAQLRADYAPYGLTPVDTFAAREGLTVTALGDLLRQVGLAGRPAFAVALDRLSRRVFGRPAGPAELRGLYLNLMYSPGAPFFNAATAVPDTLAAFARLGFNLARVPIDIEDRPRKYPGAFCFPVQVPHDVRVSVRTATAHHLVDMLYHELGHAVHFSGIDASRSFLDRYWIPSGTHEVFSTLFECLLSEPRFLAEQCAPTDLALTQLLDFAAFKRLLTGAWLGASALTVFDAWREALPWPEVEQRFAAHMLAFTGVAVPPGFARLEPFTAALSIYPAGYVLAEVRVSHWLTRLRGLGGEAWWHSSTAQDDIRAHVALGGAVRWPESWNQPATFSNRSALSA